MSNTTFALILLVSSLAACDAGSRITSKPLAEPMQNTVQPIGSKQGRVQPGKVFTLSSFSGERY